MNNTYRGPIERYFDAKGINVMYDTLNSNESLFRAYINEFQQYVDNSKMSMSQYSKYTCYKTLYDIEKRPKYTGFEHFKRIDTPFRERAKREIYNLELVDSIHIPRKENILVAGMSYKEQLKEVVKKFKKPLLYLSGGLDSELVALAMIDAGVKFQPVIFNYIDKYGKNVFNHVETQYAFKFCEKFFLTPIVKTLDIEQIWTEEWFFQLAKQVRITSPQILTHVLMVEIMEKEFPGVDHVFGGEVRFQSNTRDGDQELENLVQLTKNNPLPWAGASYYTKAASFGAALCHISMSFDTAPAVQPFNQNNFAAKFEGSPNGGSASVIGTWFTNTYLPNYMTTWTRPSTTWRVQMTINSQSGTNPGNAAQYRWGHFIGWEGYTSPAPGTSTSLYGITYTPGTLGGVHVDASTTDADITANFTVAITSNGASNTYPTSPTVSATYTTQAVSSSV